MLTRKTTKTIRKHRLILEGEHVLACVSGGPDSVCMLVLLHEISESLGLALTVAHFNHLLRGGESDRDEVFVRDLASSLKLPFITGSANVSAWGKERGMSKPEAARILRYRFFDEEAKRLGADKIALAHHADDQAETVLIRLLRGAGARGLSGILPLRQGRYIRPLLFAGKKEILAFLNERNVPFREDRSNHIPDSLRNKIRLELMPELEEQFNPSIADALCRTAEILREEDDFLEQYVGKNFSSCLAEAQGKEKVVFRRPALQGLHPAIQRRVVRMGVERLQSNLMRFSYSNLEDALELLEGGAVGKSLNWPGGLRVLFSYETISITREAAREKDAEKTQALLPVPGEIIFLGRRIISEVAEAKDWRKGADEGGTVGWMDMAKVSPPFLVRTRKDGDRFQPLGMASKKKLKDFFMDRKVPAEKRDDVPLVLSEGEIVWVGGMGISDQVKISNGAVKAIKVALK